MLKMRLYCRPAGPQYSDIRTDRDFAIQRRYIDKLLNNRDKRFTRSQYLESLIEINAQHLTENRKILTMMDAEYPHIRYPIGLYYVLEKQCEFLTWRLDFKPTTGEIQHHNFLPYILCHKSENYTIEYDS